jgi:hypothetical protein
MSDENWQELSQVRTWRARPGEELQGAFVRYISRMGRFGEYEAVLLDSSEDGYVLVSGKVLLDLLKVHGIGAGQVLKIRFEGKVVVEGTDRSWKKFSVAVEAPKLTPSLT